MAYQMYKTAETVKEASAIKAAAELLGGTVKMEAGRYRWEDALSVGGYRETLMGDCEILKTWGETVTAMLDGKASRLRPLPPDGQYPLVILHLNLP